MNHPIVNCKNFGFETKFVISIEMLKNANKKTIDYIFLNKTEYKNKPWLPKQVDMCGFLA